MSSARKNFIKKKDDSPILGQKNVKKPSTLEKNKTNVNRKSSNAKSIELETPKETTAPKEVSEVKLESEHLKKKEVKDVKKPRHTSNVFALFKQVQIQEFKEAFTMIDQNRDGFIDENDLAAMYANIGRDADPETLHQMLNEAPGQLNFTTFLTLFGEKMHGSDSETMLMDSFAMFDKEGKGKIPFNYFKELLTEVGDQFTEDELRNTLKDAPIDNDELDYIKFVETIKHGNQED
ncbi:Myosin regulatory light chain, striated adductor muscle [Intoshia linei]|uniref:Myosin regulatory light chain, striated adductor muscle n=1 Tax=Intoshia linei TaxID=1819745 RepID=A0A177B3R2_9BILA|nr:Myosin regulatory light chain, striated adductor muscle [Intoshia linei]